MYIFFFSQSALLLPVGQIQVKKIEEEEGEEEMWEGRKEPAAPNDLLGSFFSFQELLL